MAQMIQEKKQSYRGWNPAEYLKIWSNSRWWRTQKSCIQRPGSGAMELWARLSSIVRDPKSWGRHPGLRGGTWNQHEESLEKAPWFSSLGTEPELQITSWRKASRRKKTQKKVLNIWFHLIHCHTSVYGIEAGCKSKSNFKKKIILWKLRCFWREQWLFLLEVHACENSPRGTQGWHHLQTWSKTSNIVFPFLLQIQTACLCISSGPRDLTCPPGCQPPTGVATTAMTNGHGEQAQAHFLRAQFVSCCMRHP